MAQSIYFFVTSVFQAQSQRSTVRDCADTYKPSIVQMLLATHRIRTVVEARRVMEYYQEWMSFHKAWTSSSQHVSIAMEQRLTLR